MFNKIYHNTFQSLCRIKGALLVCLLCIGIFSCKKSPSDADTLQSKLASGMVSYVEGGNLVALNGLNYNFTPNYIEVPVILTETAKKTDTITSVVDPSLVDEYNKIYLEKNLSIPQGAFQVSHQGSFPIVSGSTQAKDSLHVVLNDGSKLQDSTVYLVPVTLTAKNGSKLKYSVFFFKVFVTISSLKAKLQGGSVFNSTSITRLVNGGGALSSVYINAYPDSLKYRTMITSLFPAHDVSVQATMLTDDDLNAVIIKQSWSGTLILPVANRALTKDLSTVPTKTLYSKDSVTLKFYGRASLTKLKYYVTGIKLTTYTSSIWGVPPVANDSTKAYVRVFLTN